MAGEIPILPQSKGSGDFSEYDAAVAAPPPPKASPANDFSEYDAAVSPSVSTTTQTNDFSEYDLAANPEIAQTPASNAAIADVPTAPADPQFSDYDAAANGPVAESARALSETPAPLSQQPSPSHMQEADAIMGLTPQEKYLYQYHLNNLNGNGKVLNADGRTSTIKQTTVEIGGRTYNLPTVWDGQLHSGKEAADHARQMGLQNFPSYASDQEAQARYDQMHGFMEQDMQGAASIALPKATPDIEHWLNTMGITDPKDRALFIALPNTPQGERPPFAQSIARWIDSVAAKVGGGGLENLVTSGTYIPKPGEASFTNAGIPTIPQQEGTAAQVGAGVGNVGIGFANFLLSAGGLGTIKGLGLLPKAGQILAGIGFTVQQIKQFFEAKTLQDKITSGVGAALLGLGTTLGLKGGEDNSIPKSGTKSEVPRTGEAGQDVTGDLRQVGIGNAQGEAPGAPKTETAQVTPSISQPETGGGETQPAAASSFADVGKSGGAIVSNMYEMMFRKLQRGDLTEAGQPSAALRKAKPYFDSGQIKSAEDLRKFFNNGEQTSGLPEGSMSVGGATPEEFMRRYALVGASEILKGNTEMGTKFQRGVETVFGSQIRDQIPEIYRRAMQLINEMELDRFRPTGKGALAQEINRQIGITKARETPVLVRPFVAQKAALLAAERAGKAGFKRGVKEATAEATAADKQAALEHKQLLREARSEGVAAARQIKGDLMQSDKFMAGDQEQVRKNMIEYANAVLPKEERGAFINRITKALERPALGKDPGVMYRKAFDVMRQMEARAGQVYAKSLRSEISNITDKILNSSGVSVVARDIWREKLKASPLDTLSIEELEAMRDDAALSLDLWREAEKSRKQAIVDERNLRAADLANSDTKPPREFKQMARDTTVAGWQRLKDALSNKVKGGLTWASTHEKARLFIPRLFETLDGSQEGWLTRNLTRPFYTTDRMYRSDFNPIRDKAVEIAEKNNLKHEDFMRVGIHAHLMQDGTIEEGVKFSTEPERMKALMEDVQKNGLTKGQQELYDFGRSVFKKAVPEMQQFFADHYNKELKFYDNYWPRSIDARKSAAWRADHETWTNPVSGEVIDPNQVADTLRHMADTSYRTRSVTKGFSKERVEGAEIPLNFNGMETLLKHADDWAYVKNVQPHLNMVGYLANTNLFTAKYGPEGKGMVLDYIDALARRGQYSRNNFERALDAVKNRAMVGLIGFRLNQFKHLASYPLGMYEAGGANWWERGFATALTTPEGKAFIEKNFPEIQSASGGDISIREAAAQGQKSSNAFVIDRVLDYGNRAATAMGSYLNQLSEAGYDWKNWDTIPVNEEMLNKARESYVRAIGSAEVMDRPLIVTKGTSVGSKSIGGALMAYSSPKMVRWGALRSALVEDGYRNKRFGQAATKTGIIGLGSLIESAVKLGSKAAYIAAASGILSAMGYRITQRENEKSAAHKISTEAISDLTSIVPGGGVIGKGIAVSEYPQAADKILRETGVPPFDITVGTMSDLGSYLQKPGSGKRAFRLGQDLLELSGLPVSTLLSVTQEGAKLLDEKSQQKADRAQLKSEGIDTGGTPIAPASGGIKVQHIKVRR